MDFITHFPLTTHKHNMIWIVIDQLSKQAYFIPCNKALCALQAANLFLKSIFTHYGLPRVTVSDRDSKLCRIF